jgi:hypothetical protein
MLAVTPPRVPTAKTIALEAVVSEAVGEVAMAHIWINWRQQDRTKGVEVKN